jgi:phosphatidate cytidylyltransferase
LQNETDVLENSKLKTKNSKLFNRLFFGALMTAFFAAVMIFDGWLDGSLFRGSIHDSRCTIHQSPVQGTLLCILIAFLIVPAVLELSKLAELKGLKLFVPASIIGSILFATSWYWLQFVVRDSSLVHRPSSIVLLFLAVFVLLAILLYQVIFYGTSSVLANCGANCFSICYLGLLIGFVLGIRTDFGLWQTLMFVFVVKFADMGAYAIGRLFGRHKFSPTISPSKTWEGMAGAIATAVIVAVAFAVSCDIMALWLAVIFGICFAFIGQLGDLVESMLKRDSAQKDSANIVPDFGGILDIIDSPLLAAPFAYLFFMCIGS